MTTLAACLPASEEAGTTPRTRLGVATLVLAALLTAVLLVSASRSLFYPLGQDHAFFLYVAEMLRAGQGESVAVHLKFNPVFVALQWLTIVLFGSSGLGFHAFDICWQWLTMAALITLAGRDGGRWRVGLLAATLYAMAYYGLNYQVIGGRDVWAVLPLLLMAHLLVPTRGNSREGVRPPYRCFIAGVLGFLAYMLKLPLGLGFGVLWMLVLAEAWSRRREGRSAFSAIAALTVGFLLSALTMAVVLIRVGWWQDFSPLYTNYQPRSYTTGPWMMLELAPRVLAGSALVGAVLVGVVWWSPGAGAPLRARLRGLAGVLPLVASGLFVFGLLTTIRSWDNWRAILLSVGALLVPAVGAVLTNAWRGRSAVWRMMLLLSGAAMGSVFLQGKFWYYHFVPLLAFGSYLTAGELTRLLRGCAGSCVRAAPVRKRSFGSEEARSLTVAARMAVPLLTHPLGDSNASAAGTRAWTVVCVASLVFLAANTWWPRMTAQTAAPYVLADLTLDEYRARVASHISHVPEYTTVGAVSRRVRELTTPADPIACLFLDTRIYYFSRRPMTHYIAFVFCEGWEQWYPDFMQAIRQKRPKAVLARIPAAFRDQRDPALIESAVFDDVETRFGPPGKVIRECYRLAEVIDDVCILQPVE